MTVMDLPVSAGKSSMYEGWVTGIISTTIRWINSLLYIIGVPAILLADIYLGGIVLQEVFVFPDSSWLRYAIPWVISVVTGVIQLGLWTMVFTQSRSNAAFGKIISIVGLLAALILSIVDTLLDTLCAEMWVLGSTPTNLFPAELGLNVFGAVYVLLMLISFFGEPIVLFLLYVNRDHTKRSY